MKDDPVNNDLTPTLFTPLNQSPGLAQPLLSPRIMGSEFERDDRLNPHIMIMTLEARLALWIAATCRDREASPTPQRNAELNRILRQVYEDRRFWRYKTSENAGYYEDALAKMWRYFSANLCQVTTAKTGRSFLETRDHAVGRLLKNLKGHLLNEEKRLQINKRHIEETRDTDGQVMDVEDYLPNPEPHAAKLQFQAFIALLERDPEGELTSPKNSLVGRAQSYTLTAQTYLLMYHRDGMTIQAIADALGIPQGTVQDGKWQRKCQALAQKFAQLAIDTTDV